MKQQKIMTYEYMLYDIIIVRRFVDCYFCFKSAIEIKGHCPWNSIASI